MTDYINSSAPDYKERKRVKGSTSSSVYGLAFLGALVHYLMHAATFGAGVIGILKAIVWPAFLVYGIMEYLKL